MKISISMADNLLQRADEFADANGMTRSGLISVAVRTYINSMDAAPSVTQLLKELAAFGAKGSDLSEEEKKDTLQHFEEEQQNLLELMKK